MTMDKATKINYSTMGTFIRSMRQRNGLTQKALADRLHVTDKAVSKWERDLSYPDILLLPRMAEILGVSVGDLIRAADHEGGPQQLLQNYEMTSDLRAPLHIILGCAELLESRPEEEERYRRYVEAIRISGEYLLSVLEQRMIVGLEKLLEEQQAGRREAERLYDFSGCRILIAEDIAVNREIVAEMLRHTGATMEFAEDGMACVDMVERNPSGYYDLILMDIMMPNMDGIEAARYIRGMSDPGKADIPIITMTANVTDQGRREAFEAGMNAFAEKPIFVDELLGTMKEFI